MKKEIVKIILLVVVFFLLGMVLVSTVHFAKEGVIEVPSKEEDNITETESYPNTSSLSEEELRNLVEQKRSEFKELIMNLQYYNYKDIVNTVSDEDNEKYYIVPEGFLDKVRDLFTSIAFNQITEDVTEITPDANIKVGKVYKLKKDIIDTITNQSAVSFHNVSEELLTLKSATNYQIIADMNIKLCDMNESLNCTRDDHYVFVLEKEDNNWKIAKYE